MNNAELKSEYEAIVSGVQNSVNRLGALVQKVSNPLVGVNYYEACRRAEDCVARVNNVFAILSARTDEAVKTVVDKAVGGDVGNA